MKRSLTAAIQIIFLAPAILCIPFIFQVIPTIFLDLTDHTINLTEALFGLSLVGSTLAGLIASWVVVLRGIDHIRANKYLRTVQIGLFLGIFGGCSVLIWAAKILVREGSFRGAILSWTLFLGPPIAVVTYQFLRLIRYARSDKDRVAFPAEKDKFSVSVLDCKETQAIPNKKASE